MKKYLFVVIVLFAFAATALATETTSPISPKVSGSEIFIDADQIAFKHASQGNPVWHRLDRMTDSEKANSQISIEFPANTPIQAVEIIDNIEGLWNSGSYEDAVELFRQLEDIIDINQLAICNKWRVPIRTADDGLWDADTRIGNRTEIYENDFDIHRASGNLFAALLYLNGDNYEWSMNLSSDGGDTWTETFTWWAVYYLPAVSATVVGDYCYVAYPGTTYLEDARIRRFSYNTGAPATFPNGDDWISCFGVFYPIEEISLNANQDYFNNRLYYTVLLDDGTIAYFWNNPTGVTWTEIPTGITDGDRGLDVTTNEGYSDYYVFISYLNQGDSVRVYGGSAWTHLKSYWTESSSADITAISAYADTITCAFDSHNGSNQFIYYMVNYTGGNGTWYFGSFDDIYTLSESPDVAARDGGGVGIVYRFYTTPRQERYVWRDYAGTWSTPESIADYAPWWNKPNIEYLGNDDYGVVYLTWNTPYTQAAYFDKLSGGAEPPCCSVDMVPDDDPVIVDPGGRFGLTGYAGNPTSSPQTTDVWGGVIYLGNFYQQFVFNNIPLNPGQTLSAHTWQNVPNFAPSGTYIYRAYCGDRPNDKCDSASFPFTVTGNRLESGADEWYMEGGFFEECIPAEYSLIGSYPNPFNASATITYQLPEAGDVTIEIFNLRGQKVATLVKGYMDAGVHNNVWDASEQASGVYFYRLTAGDRSFTQRMTLLR